MLPDVRTGVQRLTLALILLAFAGSCGSSKQEWVAEEIPEEEDVRLDRLWVERNVTPCSSRSSDSGSVYQARRDAALRSGPGTEFQKIRNGVASSRLNRPQYYGIDWSTMLNVECEERGWSRVKFTSPEHWSHVQGWVRSSEIQPQ